jgi:hypothetical protein
MGSGSGGAILSGCIVFTEQDPMEKLGPLIRRNGPIGIRNRGIENYVWTESQDGCLDGGAVGRRARSESIRVNQKAKLFFFAERESGKTNQILIRLKTF